MQIFNSNTNQEWLEKDVQSEPKPSPFEVEIRRSLSDVFRCNNLIILTGLGTSLCVKNDAGEVAAPTMKDLWREVQAKLESDININPNSISWDDFLTSVNFPKDNFNLEGLLSQCRLALSFLGTGSPNIISEFVKAAEDIIYNGVDFVTANHSLPFHTEFLRRVARRTNRKSRTKIFTTNYDKCFEEAGRQGRYVVIDGFSHTTPPTFDALNFTYDIVRRGRENDMQDYIPNVFHLYKLHGSIDWERDKDSPEIYKIDNPKNPLLIYPRSTKYELAFEQPYLEMMSALQTALREPDTGLLIVGFGFNDNHLSEPIMAAIKSNLSLKAAVVSPGLAPWIESDKNGTDEIDGGTSKIKSGPGEIETNCHIKQIFELTKSGDARLNLINCTFDELVQFVPDIAAETDLEKHLERVRKLEGA